MHFVLCLQLKQQIPIPPFWNAAKSIHTRIGLHSGECRPRPPFAKFDRDFRRSKAGTCMEAPIARSGRYANALPRNLKPYSYSHASFFFFLKEKLLSLSFPASAGLAELEYVCGSELNKLNANPILMPTRGPYYHVLGCLEYIKPYTPYHSTSGLLDLGQLFVLEWIVKASRHATLKLGLLPISQLLRKFVPWLKTSEKSTRLSGHIGAMEASRPNHGSRCIVPWR